MTEGEMLKQASRQIKQLKRTMRDIQKLNTDEGRLGAANAAMGLRGKLIVWHSEATASMREFYPDFADEVQGGNDDDIVAFGPGGGR